MSRFLGLKFVQPCFSEMFSSASPWCGILRQLSNSSCSGGGLCRSTTEFGLQVGLGKGHHSVRRSRMEGKEKLREVAPRSVLQLRLRTNHVDALALDAWATLAAERRSVIGGLARGCEDNDGAGIVSWEQTGLELS